MYTLVQESLELVDFYTFYGLFSDMLAFCLFSFRFVSDGEGDGLLKVLEKCNMGLWF